MKTKEERRAKMRIVRLKIFLLTLILMEIIGMVGLGLQGTYPRFAYVSEWIMLVSIALFTIFFIYLNERTFKRANLINWILIITGMTGTAYLLLNLVF